MFVISALGLCCFEKVVDLGELEPVEAVDIEVMLDTERVVVGI